MNSASLYPSQLFSEHPHAPKEPLVVTSASKCWLEGKWQKPKVRSTSEVFVYLLIYFTDCLCWRQTWNSLHSQGWPQTPDSLLWFLRTGIAGVYCHACFMQDWSGAQGCVLIGKRSTSWVLHHLQTLRRVTIFHCWWWCGGEGQPRDRRDGMYKKNIFI